MKKTYAIILMLFLNYNSIAQSIGKSVMYLVGKNFTVTPKNKELIGYGYPEFYKVVSDDSKAENVLLFYDAKNYNSNYDSLVNKTFKCISVKPWINQVDPSDPYYYAIELENPTIKSKVYYKFSTLSETYFKETFKITGLGLTDDYYCSQITTETDKISRTKTFDTPDGNSIAFSKEIKGGIATYYAILKTTDESAHGGKGFTILFKDGSRMSNPVAKVDVTVGSGAYFNHKIFFRLSPAQILKFKTGIATDMKIDVLKIELDPGEGEETRAFFNCLLNKL
ncbi:hypothetical protein BDD43_5157 [Mucilaginibacter gracilis]|uniref:NPCBM/NEW2 domain-containing protein n=1 Tax=Mucilaginibacter gracilis TaxID=423350 RepID=A0A495J929_9SPHI|nr:hypothetical protein [Mucilaginibacter gracilis]RKR84904.1 hypothetical protein BDD43_5157 [Mucilaginibacter gracilis]